MREQRLLFLVPNDVIGIFNDLLPPFASFSSFNEYLLFSGHYAKRSLVDRGLNSFHNFDQLFDFDHAFSPFFFIG